MTAYSQDELIRALTTELGTLDAASAERLCSILRGLFACMQDLNVRLEVLEGETRRASNGEN